MSTPQVMTANRSSRRTSRPTLTRYERILGLAVTAALAAVAALAFWLPSTAASADDSGSPVVSSGQVARGKATLPSTPRGELLPEASSLL